MKINKSKKALLVLFIIITGVLCIKQPIRAEEITYPITIDRLSFPDVNFRNFLLSKSYGEDGELSKEEIEKITVLDINYRVKSMNGVEYFYNLEKLYCGNFDLINLNVSSNKELKILECRSSDIESLDISNNTKLEELYCGSSNIRSLDVSNNINLKKLFCSLTKLRSLDISNNKELQELECYLTSIDSLDTSNNEKLSELRCYSTNISRLDLSNNKILTYLDCGGTDIHFIDVSNNKKLRYLLCRYTKINNIDVSHNLELRSLDVEYSKAPVWITNENQIDLTQLIPYGFDITKASDFINATCSGNILKVIDPTEMVSYTYDCGQGKSEKFSLVKTDYPINTPYAGGDRQSVEESGGSVTDITGVVNEIQANKTTTISGIVSPFSTCKKEIIWSVINIGKTEAEIGVTSEGVTITAAKEGTIELMATIKEGILNDEGRREDFNKIFNIHVTANPYTKNLNMYSNSNWQPTTSEELESATYRSSTPPSYIWKWEDGGLINYKIVNEMQGTSYITKIKSMIMEEGSGVTGWQIANTYNFYVDDFTKTKPIYSTEKKAMISLMIPEGMRKPNRNFVLVCIGKDGESYIYKDLDKDNNTITIETNQFYAYTLLYKD